MILMSSTHLFLLLHRIWKGGCTIAEAPPTQVSVHWTPGPSAFSTFPDWLLSPDLPGTQTNSECNNANIRSWLYELLLSDLYI